MGKQNSSEIRIVLTGGHAATPGMAVSEELKKKYPSALLFWIGSKYAVPGKRATTIEYKIFPEIGVKFCPLIVGKLQTKFTPYTIPLFFGIPLSFVQALWYVFRLKPKAIMAFGGFSSFPVIFWGWVFRIPIVLHEQTVVAGRASLLSGFFANKIALAREESLKFFPRSKSVVTGNPLLPQLLAIKPKVKLGGPKTILIVGGSRGSEFINDEVFKIVPELVKKYKVIHVTGERDFEKYKEVNIVGYKVFAFVDPREMARYYNEADIVISRSGASTVSEIIFVKRPAIFIPLPRTFMDEQYKNAKYAEDIGVAKVLRENEVSSESLLKTTDEMFEQWPNIVNKILPMKSPDSEASQKIVKILEEYI